jgi:hypothetical protein
MSSTNRTNAQERHIADYYFTPIPSIRDFFTAWLEDMSDEEDFLSVAHQSRNLVWLDPCAGGDELHPMSYPKFILDNILSDGEGIIDTIDIREDSLAEVKGDYLTMETRTDYDIIITNPPFNIAQQIIEKAMRDVQEGGYVIMLLRLNFLGGQCRKEFWEKYPPQRIYVHRKRMSFQDKGGTDSIEYMHCVWQKGENKKESLLRII